MEFFVADRSQSWASFSMRSYAQISPSAKALPSYVPVLRDADNGEVVRRHLDTENNATPLSQSECPGPLLTPFF